MDINKIQIDPNKAKDLWYALFGLCHAVEHFGHTDEVNTLIDKTTEMGAQEFARKTIFESIVDEGESPDDGECEECGGMGHTVGFEGSKQVKYPCESCSGEE